MVAFVPVPLTLGVNCPINGTINMQAAMLFLFIFFYKPSWGATTWIWTSEIFSMNVRSQAVGMCSQMQNVAQVIFNQFFPTFYNNKGL